MKGGKNQETFNSLNLGYKNQTSLLEYFELFENDEKKIAACTQMSLTLGNESFSYQRIKERNLSFFGMSHRTVFT